jgi:hypothetical protein
MKRKKYVSRELCDTLVKVDKPNKNGHIYPREVIDEALRDYQKQIDSQTSLGELGHPEQGFKFGLDPLLKNVSHIVTGIKPGYPKVPRKKKKVLKKLGLYKPNTYFVSYRLLNTAKGNVAKPFIKQLGPAPRGVGDVDETGRISNYTLLSVDLIPKNLIP